MYSSSTAARKVLNEEIEVSGSNYWLAPSGATGDKAYLIIDLGCIKEVSGVYLRNTHNGNYNDGGTATFSIKSKTENHQPWVNVELESNTLERVYSSELKMTKYVAFTIIVPMRYLKFNVESYYGLYGGLSYIEENEAFNAGESYPGENLNRGNGVKVLFWQFAF